MKNACTKALKRTRQGLQSLKGSPRDLYIIYAINACDNFNYFSFSLLFTLYLTEEFEFSDQQVGVLYGLWGCAITAFGFIFGGVVDYLGVKRTLFVAFTLTGCGRLLLTLSKSKALLLFSIFGPVSFGLAFGSPAVLIAVKRYTKQDNRGFAYAVLYAAMNVASLLSGWTLDLFRITFREGFHIQSRSSDSVVNSGYRLYLLLGCVAAVTGFLLNFLIDEHATSATTALDDVPQRVPSAITPLSPDQHRLTEDGDLDTSAQQEAFGKLKQQSPQIASLLDQKVVQARQHIQAELGATDRGVSSASKSAAIPNAVQQIKALTKSKEFLKYMAMCVITVNLKAIFRHLDATLPKYQVRSFGCAAPVGTVYSINPAMIMTLVPLVGAAATHYSHFDMIHYGSYVSALSPVWMALFSTEWATVLFVIQLSLGEAIWSPRWYDYSMSVAPEGREGVFTAMASAPLFLGKFVTGTASGFLLGRFCTNDGVNCEDAHPAPQPSSYRCQGHILWLIITLLTCMSPFGILVFRGWLRPAPKRPVHQPIVDTEAGQGVSRGISQESEGRHAAARMLLPEVLHEAGLGWEETTQLLQGQVTRLVSRDDADMPDLSSRSPENCELARTHSGP